MLDESESAAPGAASAASSGGSINFWPAILDMLAAALMVFVLATYVQTTLKLDDLETMLLRERKEAFVTRLNTDMAQHIARGELCFSSSPETILVRFSDQVLFQRGKAQLNQQGKRLLSRFGKLIATSVGSSIRRIQVDGHTDNTQIRVAPELADQYNNWRLSSARATSVVLHLIRHVPKLNAQLFSANGFASFRPIANNSTEAGRKLNRRVEIRLLFDEPKNEPKTGQVITGTEVVEHRSCGA